MPINSKKSLQDVNTLISQLSELTGLSKEQISDQISSLQIPTFQFNDAVLVSLEDFEQIIDAWAVNVKTSLRKGKPSLSATPLAKREEEDVIDLSDRPQSQALNLQWPKGYEQVVTHLYSTTLSRVLPELSEEKHPFLEAIAQKTEEGQRLVDELAHAIVKRAKRKLSLEKMKDGLQAKVEEMYKVMNEVKL